MAFNAQRLAIAELRRLIGDDLRPSDFDGMDVKAALKLIRKVAVHGTADSWTETSDPYKTSPLVNPQWEMGGRWRSKDFGGGDNHINDDGDKEKSTKGEARDEDFDPNAQNNKINDFFKDLSKKSPDSKYIVRIRIPEGQDPNKIISTLGPGASYDGKMVNVTIDDFSRATELQRIWPGAIVETRKGKGA